MPDTSIAGRWALAWARRLGALTALAFALLLLGAQSASAHVVPWTTMQLDVQDGDIQATVSIPLDDIAAATGIDLGAQTQADIDADSAEISAYLLAHLAPTSDDGRAWVVESGTLTVAGAGDPSTTGVYRQLVTTFTLIPPPGDDGRSFVLGYTAVVEKVITHVTVVTVHSDWAAGHDDGSYELGIIELDTASGAVPAFHVDLDDGSTLRGFLSMLTLGVRHIEEGTDHQLFLLALLVPAPLMAVRGRWTAPATTRQSLQRIGRITAAFTLGHSVTLALGTLGLPVPRRPIEALIAVSIIVAAAHAIRPIFPGREALVAAAFGLVHGLAFSETLRELDLSGRRLVLSLLGFNLGIELMQLLIVALVLPPLILLAQSRRYRLARIAAASIAGIAAAGWLADRIGHPNPIADAADSLSGFIRPIIAGLWIAAIAAALLGHRRGPSARSLTRSGPPTRRGLSEEQPLAPSPTTRPPLEGAAAERTHLGRGPRRGVPLQSAGA
ncbi:MAG: hypothetical protein JWN20_2555 [Jatrophihabitantaceae bacterium]|nr:hypothetical protein [Jatrophihabitantaceae bacterium]